MEFGPYESAPAVCNEHNKGSFAVARALIDAIQAAAPELRVEHIGSTSVAGCPGKGVVDLQVLYPAGLLEAAKALLQQLGFSKQCSRNPWPEERPMRTAAVTLDGATFRVHAHVIACDAGEARENRRFAALLRANPELVASYAARKREIIAQGPRDSAEYAEQKSAFIEKVLRETR